MSDLSIAIDLSLSPADNMHAIISAAALEAIPKDSYILGNPQPHQDASTRYNTSVVITSRSSRYSGSDTHFYHRPDISSLADQTVDGYPIITKPFDIESEPDKLAVLCERLGIMRSEFTLEAVQQGESTHVIRARTESYLYVGSLYIRIGAPAVVNTAPVVIANIAHGFTVARDAY